LTEKSRLREIRRISKNQLEQETDLPHPKRISVEGKRSYVKVFPMNPLIMDKIFPSAHPDMPEAERTYIRGREWSIERH